MIDGLTTFKYFRHPHVVIGMFYNKIKYKRILLPIWYISWLTISHSVVTHFTKLVSYVVSCHSFKNVGTYLLSKSKLTNILMLLRRTYDEWNWHEKIYFVCVSDSHWTWCIVTYFIAGEWQTFYFLFSLKLVQT